MTIFPILETYWDERSEEMVDSGSIIGYEAIGSDGKVLAQGETIAEATEAALAVIYSSEPKNTQTTSKKLIPIRQSGGKCQNTFN